MTKRGDWKLPAMRLLAFALMFILATPALAEGSRDAELARQKALASLLKDTFAMTSVTVRMWTYTKQAYVHPAPVSGKHVFTKITCASAHKRAPVFHLKFNPKKGKAWAVSIRIPHSSTHLLPEDTLPSEKPDYHDVPYDQKIEVNSKSPFIKGKPMGKDQNFWSDFALYTREEGKIVAWDIVATRDGTHLNLKQYAEGFQIPVNDFTIPAAKAICLEDDKDRLAQIMHDLESGKGYKASAPK